LESEPVGGALKASIGANPVAPTEASSEVPSAIKGDLVRLETDGIESLASAGAIVPESRDVMSVPDRDTVAVGSFSDTVLVASDWKLESSCEATLLVVFIAVLVDKAAPDALPMYATVMVDPTALAELTLPLAEWVSRIGDSCDVLGLAVATESDGDVVGIVLAADALVAAIRELAALARRVTGMTTVAEP